MQDTVVAARMALSLNIFRASLQRPKVKHNIPPYLCLRVKKYIAILLCSLYLVSVFGARVSRFYCCGVLKTQSVGLAFFSKQTAKDDACCRHTQTVVKVSDNQQERATAYSLQISGFDAACVKPVVANWQITNPFVSSYTNFANSPPGLQQAVALYIRICAYRI